MPSEISPGGLLALHIYLLGGFHVSLGSQAIGEDAWLLRRARTLVKVLALAPEHRLHREQALDVLWPDAELKDASNSLHQVLHAARSALERAAPIGSDYLQFQGEMLLLATEHPLWIDVEAFEAAAVEARRSQDPVAYRAGLALYTGDLLPEDLYEDWSSQRRDLLHQTYLGLMLDLARILEAQHQFAEASALSEHLLRLDPTNEEAYVVLIRLLALTGHHQNALSHYQALSRILQQELGTTPQPTTQRLFQDIQAGRFPPLEQHLLHPSEKDMWQANVLKSSSHLEEMESFLSPVADREAQTTNLPVQVNSFIGRSREVAEISNLLKRSRIITITGVGGSGKTRLALQIAEKLLPHFPDGVWLIELASLRQSSLIPEVVAQVLGFPEQPERPLIETLIDFLKPKQILLVLDNCEHLIDSCARLSKVLMLACPRLFLLCTSREPLHIPGEVTWRVSSLSLPDVQQHSSSDEISRSEAVQLFIDRARAVQPNFTLTANNTLAVAQICYLLDGLPLALELAAARVSALSTEQIAVRLDNSISLLTTGNRTALTRQQTLKAALDWSYDLLSDSERVLFRQLAVFAGGFDLDAVEAVGTQKDREEGEVFDLLASLVDKSMVVAEERTGQVRYRLLEPVRQYAEYLLEHSGEAKQVRRSHRDWFLVRVEQANSALWGAQHNFWVAYLEREYDNLRAALGWSVREVGEVVAGLQLASILWQFWLLRGHLVEGRRWLELYLKEAPAPTVLRAEALLYAYALSIRQAEFTVEAGRTMIEQSLSIYKDLGDLRGINHALQMYGIQAYMAGDYGRARTSFGEILKLSQKAGYEADCALAMYSIGVVEYAQGDFPLARQRLVESLALLRGLDDQPDISFALLNLARLELPFNAAGQVLMVDEETWVLLRTLSAPVAAGYVLANLGSLARLEATPGHANAYLEESKALFQELEDKAGLGQVLGQIGNLYRLEHKYGQAHALLEQSLTLRRELSDHRGFGRTLNNLGVLAMVEGNYRRADALFEQSLAHFTSMGDMVGITATFDDQGHLALFEGDYSRARKLYAESIAINHKQGDVIHGSAAPIMHQGIAAWAAGDFAAARTSFEESLAIYTQLGDQRGIARLRHLLDNLDRNNRIPEEPAAPST